MCQDLSCVLAQSEWFSQESKQSSLAAAFKKAGAAVQLICSSSSQGAKRAKTLIETWQDQELAPQVQEQQQIVSLPDEVVEVPTLKVGGSYNKFGLKRANIGGRPAVLPVVKRGVAGVKSVTNRVLAGEKPRRFEIKGGIQKKIVDRIDELKAEFGTSRADLSRFWKQVYREFPDVDRDRLQKMACNADSIRTRVGEQGLGGDRGFGGAQGRSIPTYLKARQNKGIRAGGAGNKWHFTEITKEVKDWHEHERRMAHVVDRTDILVEFQERLEVFIPQLEKLAEAAIGTAEEKMLAEKIKAHKDRQESLKTGTKVCRERFRDRVIGKLGARLLVPQRYVKLTPKEEQVRCELTWQQFDERCWIAGLSPMNELSKWVADPQLFRDQAQDTWLVFSDQIPFWVKIGFLKILYAEFELKEACTQKKKSYSKTKKGNQLSSSPAQHSQALVPGDPSELEGQSQKRGADPSGDKCRITFEARQAISGWFGGDRSTGGAEVKGHILPSIIVVKGQYARLDNISDAGTFIRDEIFWVGDKKFDRKAGTSTKGLMASYVELRKRRPELFKNLVVFQQPAAWMDEITQLWAIEDLARRVPQAVHQRDLFAAALSDTCKKGMQLGLQIPSWIASKMSAVLQLTDTDVAFPMKRDAEAAKEELSRAMRSAAARRGERASFHCGAEQIMEIAAKAHEGMIERNAKSKIVLAGSRRNGMLAWRPDLNNQVLYDPAGEEWCRDFPQSSHRLKESWIADRHKWLDADGRPKRADWSRSDAAETEADLAEHDYCSKMAEHMQDHTVEIGGKIIEVPVINIDSDDQSLFSDADALASLHPKLRRMVKAALKNPRNDKSAVARAAQKKLEKDRVQSALNELGDQWREMLAKALPTTSRGQMLASLQPGVAGKDKKKMKKHQKKVLKGKLKIKFLKLAATSAKMKASSSSSTDAALPSAASSSSSSMPMGPPPLPAPAKDAIADLKQGDIVRCIEESLGRSNYGLDFEILKVFGSSYFCRLQEAGSCKIGKNVSLHQSQVVLAAQFEAVPKKKQMTWPMETKVELDMKFPAAELDGGSSLKKDARIAAIHISLAVWLLRREMLPAAADDDKVAFLSPEMTGQVFAELSGSNPAQALCDAAAAVKAIVKESCQLIMVPVWGGAEGALHWTLLLFKKMGDGSWRVEYKDSLSKICKNSYEAGTSLITLIAVALNIDLKMPATRCNSAYQAIGSGQCGYFVVHWMDEAIKEVLGYGPAAAGWPMPQFWINKLSNIITQITKNKGISELKLAKAKAKSDELKAEAQAKLEAVGNIAKDLKFQEGVRASTETRLKFYTWASTGGCPKCKHAEFGSTCCNPDKILAKQRAEKMQADKTGKPVKDKAYSAEDYKKCLADIYAEIAVKRGMPPMPPLPSLKDAAGGQVN